ncbi:hypothetical protein PPGU19_097570 (plasmid) [Paraburkholderia sp. PGU19]|uniref:hypothetical protein n=1 Tax=Paraburkholderia sp. PGU19 TaxID=2735434 RepID=UPI0015DA9E77|nr:hypothetical protein [Paraburkholderia sp. PGU19]BCG05189.1 hypothetical protein PPGU19_097570 [Paraburkholderia sp. PGU19]
MSKTTKSYYGDIELRLVFKVELARGASHIASTLSAASTAAAVAEVLEQFVMDCGLDKFDEFGALLIEDLKKRRCFKGAHAVDAYMRARAP